MPAIRQAAAVLARVGTVLRRVIGAPDYERYVEHVRTRRPLAAPLSRDEFMRQRLADRYERPGARCC